MISPRYMPLIVKAMMPKMQFGLVGPSDCPEEECVFYRSVFHAVGANYQLQHIVIQHILDGLWELFQRV